MTLKAIKKAIQEIPSDLINCYLDEYRAYIEKLKKIKSELMKKKKVNKSSAHIQEVESIIYQVNHIIKYGY